VACRRPAVSGITTRQVLPNQAHAAVLLCCTGSSPVCRRRSHSLGERRRRQDGSQSFSEVSGVLSGRRRTASLVGLSETTAPLSSSVTTEGRLATIRSPWTFERSSATCRRRTTDGLSSRSERQHHREVGVGRDQDPIAGSCAAEDLLVRGGVESEVGYVRCFLTGVAQPCDELWREVCVLQEPHAGRAIGTSRSFTTAAAYSSAATTSARSR
jgi:hypothetical protein